MSNSTQRRWVYMIGVFLFVCLLVPLGALGQQSSPPPAAGAATALIVALAAIVVALISGVTAAIVARITSHKAIQKLNPISLDELLKPDGIKAIKDAGHFVNVGEAITLDELLRPVNIRSIRQAGGFVRERELLEKLMQSAILQDELFLRLRRMLLDKSEVAQMIEKSAAEREATTKRIFQEVRDLRPPPGEN